MPRFDRRKIGRIPLAPGRIVRSYRFALAAFLIPLFIRSIPEILVGPYPIGWDTIAFYVPNTLDWATGKTGLQSDRNNRIDHSCVAGQNSQSGSFFSRPCFCLGWIPGLFL